MKSLDDINDFFVYIIETLNNVVMNCNNAIIRLADKFSYLFPHIKEYIKPIYHKLFLDRYYKKRREAFFSKAYEVIHKFDECLSEADLHYSLAFGSMLGAVREKGIIGHDADMDTVIWAENGNHELVKKALESGGFKRTRCLLVNNGDLGREETYEYDSVPVDVFYIYPAINKLPYTCLFVPKKGYPTKKISMDKVGEVQAIRMDRPYVKEYVRMPFGPLSLPVMKDYDAILKGCYGDNYMIPDPNFKRLNIVTWENVHATMIGGI